MGCHLQRDLAKLATTAYLVRWFVTLWTARLATSVQAVTTAQPAALPHRAVRQGRLCRLLEAVLSAGAFHARLDITAGRTGYQLSADNAQRDTTVQRGSRARSQEAIFAQLGTIVRLDRHCRSIAGLARIRIRLDNRHASNV